MSSYKVVIVVYFYVMVCARGSICAYTYLYAVNNAYVFLQIYATFYQSVLLILSNLINAFCKNSFVFVHCFTGTLTLWPFASVHLYYTQIFYLSLKITYKCNTHFPWNDACFPFYCPCTTLVNNSTHAEYVLIMLESMYTKFYVQR